MYCFLGGLLGFFGPLLLELLFRNRFQTLALTALQPPPALHTVTLLSFHLLNELES